MGASGGFIIFRMHQITSSINSGIPEEYGSLTYSTIDQAIEVIQTYGRNCQLIKRDFASAFRHIPVSPLNIPLLGFHWNARYYAQRFLLFGFRTAPYLFNLFAEVFHGILERQFELIALRAQVIHYFDDVLIVCSGPEDPTQSASLFTTLSSQVEVGIKVAKNEQGCVASFGGVELDTGKMIVRLPLKKLEKARTIVRTAIEKHSLLLLEIQKITSYLNFVAVVVPLGQTFLRHLYNMKLYFPSRGISYRRRILQEARRDLTWWSKVLANSPERSIMPRE